MLKDYFCRYLTTKNKSSGHYITGINTINGVLQKNGFPIKDVFEVTSVSDLDAIRLFLAECKEFQEKDTTGHRMYSVAFNHFYKFAAEDQRFFAGNILKMDMPVEPMKCIKTKEGIKWERNKIITAHSLMAAHYQCEYDSTHKTFLSAATGQQYMEGHHLIPVKYQSQFSSGIDIYANIVCLCPICHRLLHYGTTADRTYAAEKLYDIRAMRLQASGIRIGKKDFLDLVM